MRLELGAPTLPEVELLRSRVVCKDGKGQAPESLLPAPCVRGSQQGATYSLAFCLLRNGENRHMAVRFIGEVVAPSFKQHHADHSELRVVGDEQRRS